MSNVIKQVEQVDACQTVFNLADTYSSFVSLLNCNASRVKWPAISCSAPGFQREVDSLLTLQWQHIMKATTQVCKPDWMPHTNDGLVSPIHYKSQGQNAIGSVKPQGWGSRQKDWGAGCKRPYQFFASFIHKCGSLLFICKKSQRNLFSPWSSLFYICFPPFCFFIPAHSSEPVMSAHIVTDRPWAQALSTTVIAIQSTCKAMPLRY